MNTIAQTAVDLLEREETFVLATIVSHSGSTPRTSGTKMIITAAGRGFGTIGGGLLEAGAMSRAVELIRSGRSALMPVDLSHQTVASMDMICGGQAEVLLDCVAPTDVNRSVFRHWQQLLEQGGNGCLLTRVRMVDDSVQAVDHSLITPAGVIHNELSLSDDERNQIAAASASASTHTLAVDGGFVVLDPAGWTFRAHLFGAGHVSRPTAQLAAQVGFWVSVADDREEYANSDRFPDAREIRVLKSFENCLASPAMGRDDYVVILTRGHLYDKTVLGQVLKTGAGYVGMIGSRRKSAAIYQALLEEGFSRTDIDRVHSPIGLSIGAETPEEIAVSIVGELIAVRAGIQP